MVGCEGRNLLRNLNDAVFLSFFFLIFFLVDALAEEDKKGELTNQRTRERRSSDRDKEDPSITY